mgnify:CR=1 FL=1
MNTPMQQALQFAKLALWGQISEQELEEQFKILISSEQEEIELAWMDGNAKGWAMETDWPQHATEYFKQRFKQPKG